MGTEVLGGRLRRSALGSSGRGIALRRPPSPVVALSHSTAERLNSPLSECSAHGPAKSSSAPILPPASERWLLSSRIDEKVSRNKRAFDRRLSRDFAEIDFRAFPRLEGSHSTLSLTNRRQAASPERREAGLSFVSRRENFRKDRLEARFQSTREDGGGCSPGGASSPDLAMSITAEEFGLVKPEVFIADIAQVERQFGELERSLRLEHMTENGQAERVKAEREAERRRREEALRRARKKEQQARDPKKKVALRIENKREFEKEKIETNPNIPMRTVDFGGGYKGHEHVPLVDVQMLRSKCCFMEPGLHVPQMVESMAARERQEAALNFKMNISAEKTSTWTPNTAASPGGLFTSSSLSSLGSYDARQKSAMDLRSTSHVNSLLQRIKTMRNNLTYTLPYKFEVADFEHALEAGSGSDRLRIAPPAFLSQLSPSQSKVQDRQVAHLLAEHFLPQEADGDDEDSALSMLKIRRATTQQIALAAVAGEAGASIVGATLDRRKKAEMQRRRQSMIASESENEARRKKVHTRWTMARALAQWIMLGEFCKRRNKSMDIIKDVLVQLGEWARMRRAIHHFSSTILTLQRTAKNFVAIKKKRCAIIDKDWVKVEDHILQSYFREIGLRARFSPVDGEKGVSHLVKSRKPQKSKAGYSKFDDNGSTEDGKESVDNHQERSYDWRTYRIPAKVRKEHISRFYMSQLRSRVQQEKHFLETVKVAITAERDLVHFLRNFGATDDSIRDLCPSLEGQSEICHHDFWHVPEDQLLQMITSAAQTLNSDAHLRVHDRGLQRFCGVQSDAENRAASKGARVAEDKSQKSGKRQNKVDVDEVLGRLSPRLREISEEMRDVSGERFRQGAVKNDGLVLGFVNHAHMQTGAASAGHA